MLSLIENYKDAWYRLRPDEPARTVKENHGGVSVHYKEPRCLTPRELARLLSFRDDFRFTGSKSDVLKQIGNAVPPLLAQRVARQILRKLKGIALVEEIHAGKICATPS
jgi:DNA (cytosine-5)-methyltransferase 1